MNGYSVSVASASHDLTPKQRVQAKDTTNCVRLDKATQEGAVYVTVDHWIELAVHNERAADQDYANYVVVDKDGTRYITGSHSFWDSFMNIFEEMKDIDEAWTLKIYRMESKNRAGKQFITCSVE